MKHLYIIIYVLMVSLSAMAESDRDCIRHGNHLYNEKDFDGALGEYTKAIGHNADNAIAFFNSGCVQIQLCDKTQKLNEKLSADSAAVEVLEKAVELFRDDRTRRGFAYHNLGLIYHKEYYYFDEASETFRKQNDFQDAQASQQNKITALQNAIIKYKCALRCNPKDDETRYNLALCQYLLKKNQKDNKNNQNQNQNQNQNNNQDKKQNQDKNKNDNENDKKKNNNNKKPQPKDGQMSKDNAQQLLQAARQQEQQTQQRLKRQAVKEAPSREKNW